MKPGPSNNVFPRWLNRLRIVLGAGAAFGGVYVVTLFAYGASPKTLNVGFAPEQPVAFSHALHAGELALDCRYCHTTVELGARAAVPPTETCMNCHARIRTQSEALAPIVASWTTGEPVHWKRVHDLPDYVYFDHSAHVTRGVGCVTCHGRIDTMDRVRQEQPLSMGWCLDCHRDPTPNLRPPQFATSMEWQPDKPARELGAELARARNIRPSTDCSTCHR
ncbi:MAG: cytochrome c3 family protein [Planctomycetes bacterium]|nr:cytochrome c3 family protein [Planctomycetota bacterium]